MEYRVSAETDAKAFDALMRVDRLVEALLTEKLAASSLALLKCTLRYVPIVMPPELLSRYPARSKLRRKERLYDCAPQLNYDVFVTGDFESQVREYVSGLLLSAPHLAGIGASAQQIDEFKRILDDVIQRIIAEQPDQTRH